ncbi:MAG: disulfide bond formation protein B [Rhodospirillaceae bacterium]|nr:disulfide bond formation protein B [Rhodospirillaceae bacterium]
MTENKSFLTMALIAAASAAALGLAYTAQYGFALWPCNLCWGQRVPYALALVFAAMSMTSAVDAATRRQVALLCAALFFFNAAFAFYHVGVEQKWWLGPTECVGRPQTFSTADLMSALTQTGRTGCDEVAFSLFGISMAGYNVIAQLILGVGLLWASTRDWWSRA